MATLRGAPRFEVMVAKRQERDDVQDIRGGCLRGLVRDGCVGAGYSVRGAVTTGAFGD